MRLDDPRDLLHLTPIVSRAVLEPRAVQPELRMAAVALYVDMRRLTAIVHAKPKCESRLAVERRHNGNCRHRPLPGTYHPIVGGEHDHRVRLAAFQWLRAQMDVHGEMLPRLILAQGFMLDDRRVPLLGPQGIFKPAVCEIPLSITTSPNSPYSDSWTPDNRLRYAYRGSDPGHGDNRGLRRAMQTQTPLVYFFGIAPGQYLVTMPVYIVGDHPELLSFEVQVDDAAQLNRPPEPRDMVSEDRAAIRREYVTSIVRRRVHQLSFRARVIEAYRTRCAFCRLRHQELLDAAHITADAAVTGEPVVSNGLSLCKLHHAAFDRQFLTVRPDYTIEVRQSILDEEDGPMLLHGLKGMHGTSIYVPREASLQPDRLRLEERYAAFLRAAP